MTAESGPRALRIAGACLLTLLVTGCASWRPWQRGAPAPVELELTLDRAAALRPPENLRATPSAGRTIGLAWDAVTVGDVAGYAILRAPGAAGDYRQVGYTGSRFETVYTDRGRAPGALGDGQVYHYRVHPYDSRGRMSPSHAYIRAATEPPPDTPGAFDVYSNQPRRVALRWEPSERLSTVGYAVYRAPTAAGNWEAIARIDDRLETVYVDEIPGDLRVLYYRVTARNAFGAESEPTEARRAYTKPAPLPPLDLRVAERALGSLTLEWEPNVERDLAGYEVFRAEAGRGSEAWGPEVRLGRVAADVTRFVDPDVDCAQPVRYRVRGLDADGLTGRFSDPLEATGQDLGLLPARADDGGRELRWDPALADGWSVARVERLRAWPLPPALLGEVPAEAGRFEVPTDTTGAVKLAVGLEREGDAATIGQRSPVCEARVPVDPPPFEPPPPAAPPPAEPDGAASER